ncbi:hypothetical protein GCM10017691_57040 [Pseudonocardia petroleophila]|uniref:Tetratricopeptide repeat-containing protein n=1 Tax=Pseudonocardia petroleophila TaxID=37331 RepID=A0A7G7MN87_9PSEU|nr:hypothetical protein [Pseudonocardia petroleophila]QNG54248.1 hypothetical protein H6H00_10315 [Pseudonocardia petroleophila]
MSDGAPRRPGGRIAPSAPYTGASPSSADPGDLTAALRRGQEAEEAGREGLALRCYEQGAAVYATAAAPAEVARPQVALCLLRSAALMDRSGTYRAAGQRYLEAADVLEMLGRDAGRRGASTVAAVARAEAEQARASAESAIGRATEAGRRTDGLLRADAAQRSAHFDAFARLLGRI